MTARDVVFSFLVGLLVFALALGVTGVVLIQIEVGAIALRPELENWVLPGAGALPRALAISTLPGAVALAVTAALCLRPRARMSVGAERI
ncbi:hypothetical protein [Antiquaquibacter soli]|uniref:FtsX-like permease family protein n=1 Tax=Antiquaquibacter soli TaxID=3064523 RepID=A0ABT9BIQ3_9MICO|nr:hypothetical protein [Protaetiibacter sp. WY-16]MDO7880908.1 hypothetical protein [Protaetiibacter sp. WY-16]